MGRNTSSPRPAAGWLVPWVMLGYQEHPSEHSPGSLGVVGCAGKPLPGPMLEPKPALPVVPAAIAGQELNPPGPSPGADVALKLVPMPVLWCWCARGFVHGCREHHPLPAELLPSEGGEPCGPLLWGSPGPGQHDKVVKRSLRCLPAPGARKGASPLFVLRRSL